MRTIPKEGGNNNNNNNNNDDIRNQLCLRLGLGTTPPLSCLTDRLTVSLSSRCFATGNIMFKTACVHNYNAPK